MEGTIVRIIADKGFGFVRGEDNQDYFFHQTDLNGFFADLVQDFDAGRKIKVTFEPISSTKGPRATVVTRIDAGV